MKRLIWVFVLVELGLVLIGLGLLIPEHLRAVDALVIQQSGFRTHSVVDAGIKLVSQEKVGPAQLMLQVAQAEKAPTAAQLKAAVDSFNQAHPDLTLWGGADPYLERLFPRDPAQPRLPSQPIADFVQRDENRERLLEFLLVSRRPSVAELLKTRNLTNTVYFPAVPTASGKVLDAMIILTGLLLQGDHLSPPMQEAVATVVQQANRTGDSQKFERLLLDLLSLGKRLNWVQLTQFLSHIENVDTLRSLVYLARSNDAQMPVVYTAVCLGDQPAAVADYLVNFKDTGFKDLSFALGAGLGGLQKLLGHKQRVYYPLIIREYVVAYEPFKAYFFTMLDGCRAVPWVMLGIKYLFFLLGGFFLARSYPYWRPAVPVLEQPLQVPSLAPARQGIWAFIALLVMIFLSEPFLAQESQQVVVAPLRLQLPRVGSLIAAGAQKPVQLIMNPVSLLSLLIFFVLQALLYTVCLIKLAEIRRQNAEPRLKLRLLENEEHLFDAGLYLGFVGTIISLILMSMHYFEFSLMAGYSSTSFGIIFVSILKIFNVRPLRRKLILESEAIRA